MKFFYFIILILLSPLSLAQDLTLEELNYWKSINIKDSKLLGKGSFGAVYLHNPACENKDSNPYETVGQIQNPIIKTKLCSQKLLQIEK